MVSNDFDFLVDCFDKMEKEDQRVKIAIQETLHSMCQAYAKTSSPETISKIRNFLLSKVSGTTDYLVKFTIIFYANRLFPFSDPQGTNIIKK